MSRGTVGKWLFNLVVLLAFAGAVVSAYTLVRSSGILGTTGVPAVPEFADIPLEDPQRVAIEKAVQLGLVKPSSDQEFGPLELVTRAAFAEGVVAAMDWKVTKDEQQPFADVEGRADQLDPADYVAVVYREGVMSGPAADPPEFQPNDPVLLSHAVIVAVRAGGSNVKEPTIPAEDIDALDLPDGLKSALQAAAHSGLLAGTGIDPQTSDFQKPAAKAQVAALLVNLRTAVGKD
ncbi:MAG: S-layer homology domain-containing protein [Thermoleophilia bacterium]|nr:S-layer homology domain-containing protein [Thermoleophilia bacterium]